MAALICLALGGVQLQWNITDVREDERLLTAGKQAQGVVTRTYLDRQGAGRGVVDETVASIDYSPSNGPEMSIDHTVRGEPAEELVGSEVTVFYNPEDPSEVVVEKWRQNYGWQTVVAPLMMAGGAFILVLSMRSLIQGRRKRADKPL